MRVVPASLLCLAAVLIQGALGQDGTREPLEETNLFKVQPFVLYDLNEIPEIGAYPGWLKAGRGTLENTCGHVQGVSQDLELGCPNLLSISKTGCPNYSFTILLHVNGQIK